MDKRFWAVIGVVLVVFMGVVLVNGQKNKEPVVNKTSHVAGNLSSKVTLTEYGDYQCSACGQFYPITKQVKATYADRIRFEFRNLPLVTVHPNAFAAARAAEAADMQGKFWEMHDLLYENQDPYGTSGWVASKDPLNDFFSQYAKQLSLDTVKFKTDFASNIVNNRINADIDAFKATGNSLSTPTFFLNGKKIDSTTLLDEKGAPSAARFGKILDEALGKS